MTEPDLKTLWQAQPKEYDPMTVAEIRTKAQTMQKRVRRRNLTEYAACVIVVVLFAPFLARTDAWMLQVGGALVIAATGYVAWQLHRRGSARAAPEDGAAVVAFQREELVRQRDALRSVGSWYLAPMLPGLAFITLARWFQWPVKSRPPETDHLIIILTGVIMLLFMGVVWLLNLRGADRLQQRIDELDALERG